MGGIIKKANIFPYQDMWRMGKQSQINYTLGGIISIFVFILIGILTLLKFVQIFQLNTITSSSVTSLSLLQAESILTTATNNPNANQWMFALDLTGLNRSDITVRATYRDQEQNATTNQWYTITVPIVMQPCTADHFSKMQGVYENFTAWGMNDWLCMPINQTYAMGGVINGRGFYFVYDIYCKDNTQSCSMSKTISQQIIAYAMTSLINPSDRLNPFQFSIQRITSDFSALTYNKNSFFIDRNILITDQSLGPIESPFTQTSLSLNPNIDKIRFIDVEPWVRYTFQLSGTTITVNRKYLKILEGFAYIGGMFSSLLGAFFFMNIFGRIIFQMKFAAKVFKKKQFQTLGFTNFVGLFVYKILSALNKQPNWTLYKDIVQYKQTVNSMLDIIYLQKRIMFLEKALTFLFQKHQLKGLYLLHQYSKEQIDYNFKNYRIRNRLIDYFQKKQTFQTWFQQKNQIMIQQLISSSTIKSKRPKSLKNRLQKLKMRQIKSIQLMTSNKKSSQRAPNKQYEKKGNIIKQQQEQQIDYPYAQKRQEQRLNFKDWPIDNLQENEKQIDQQFAKSVQQLKKLSIEANERDGDPISKKIFRKINRQLQIRLQKSVGINDQILKQ